MYLRSLRLALLFTSSVFLLLLLCLTASLGPCNNTKVSVEGLLSSDS